MTPDEVSRIIPEIEQDITYFNNIGFEHLADKFIRDLKCIKSLLPENNKKEG